MFSSLLFFRLHPLFSNPFFALSPHSINPHSLPPLHFSYPPLYPILTSNSLSLIPPHSLAPVWPFPIWAFQPSIPAFAPLICVYLSPLFSLSSTWFSSLHPLLSTSQAPYFTISLSVSSRSITRVNYSCRLLAQDLFHAHLLPCYFHFHDPSLNFLPIFLNSAQSNAKFFRSLLPTFDSLSSSSIFAQTSNFHHSLLHLSV